MDSWEIQLSLPPLWASYADVHAEGTRSKRISTDDRVSEAPAGDKDRMFVLATVVWPDQNGNQEQPRRLPTPYLNNSE